MYEPNSNKYKEEKQKKQTKKKEIKKVVKDGEVKMKKNHMRKLTDIFVPEDVSDVKTYVLSDVMIPAIKQIFEDTVHAFLYGSSGGSSRTRKSTPYYKEYDKRSGPVRTSPRTRVNSLDDISLASRVEAEEVLDQMNDIINEYESVSVADLYYMIGVNSEWTDNKYGWYDIRDAYVRKEGRYYVLKMPRPVALD